MRTSITVLCLLFVFSFAVSPAFALASSEAQYGHDDFYERVMLYLELYRDSIRSYQMAPHLKQDLTSYLRSGVEHVWYEEYEELAEYLMAMVDLVREWQGIAIGDDDAAELIDMLEELIEILV